MKNAPETIMPARKSPLRMSRIRGKLISGILMLSVIFGLGPRAVSAQTQSLVEGNTAFALDLYGRLRTSQGTSSFRLTAFPLAWP